MRPELPQKFRSHCIRTMLLADLGALWLGGRERRPASRQRQPGPLVIPLSGLLLRRAAGSVSAQSTVSERQGQRTGPDNPTSHSMKSSSSSACPPGPTYKQPLTDRARCRGTCPRLDPARKPRSQKARKLRGKQSRSQEDRKPRSQDAATNQLKNTEIRP